MDVRGDSRSISVFRLGHVEYEDGWTLQKRFREARIAGTVGDCLFLLEHPPVITLGRGAKRKHLLWSPAKLEAAGISVHETERGGDVTYHGPGQLVVYPILSLTPDRQDVRRYVRSLEEAVIRTLSVFEIEAHHEPQWPGVWVGSAENGDLAKIAALGVHISRWVTLHGFALNVDPDLTHFESIVPCGIHGARVTSMAQQLGRAIRREEVEEALLRTFAEVFDATLVPSPSPFRTVSVYPVRELAKGEELLLLKRTADRGGFWQPVTGRVRDGESPVSAAARELEEETGSRGKVISLDYRHTFGWGDSSPPAVLEESAFMTCWQNESVRLSPEHEAAEWVTLSEALARLPFPGLREGARRAAQRPS